MNVGIDIFLYVINQYMKIASKGVEEDDDDDD